ncbi:uncharacterized protein [Periplaneta americana]|uniref:uncharacterized protein isoform X2 n=1 Tax=Periplaneta americana TaxID=6978 RepID=UPI0037E771AD
MDDNTHVSCDMTPRSALCRSPLMPVRMVPSVPEVSLMLGNNLFLCAKGASHVKALSLPREYGQEEMFTRSTMASASPREYGKKIMFARNDRALSPPHEYGKREMFSRIEQAPSPPQGHGKQEMLVRNEQTSALQHKYSKQEMFSRSVQFKSNSSHDKYRQMKVCSKVNQRNLYTNSLPNYEGMALESSDKKLSDNEVYTDGKSASSDTFENPKFLPFQSPKTTEKKLNKEDENQFKERAHGAEVESAAHIVTLDALYRLVLAQSEQLKCLQERVDCILANTERVPVPHRETSEKSTQTDVQMVSVGTMKPLSESALSPDLPDETICLNSVNIATVPEHIPSPQSSIHVSMQDYEEDEGDCCGSHVESGQGNLLQPVESQSEATGWTFYNDLVGQVNKLLKEPEEEMGCVNQNSPGHEGQDVAKEQTRLRPQAPPSTRRFEVESVQCPQQRIQVGSSDSDISVHINALARKYLGAEASAKTSSRTSRARQRPVELPLTALQDPEHYVMLPTEAGAAGSSCEYVPRHHRPAAPADKILDISTLKRQPKLL